MKKIAIVIPCYNEEEALPITAEKILSLLDGYAAQGRVSGESFLLCVDDGSTDGTWREIRRLHAADPRVKGLSLAHNRGHQFALLAGLMACRGHCDAAISIDADLQDDPEAIGRMVDEFVAGKEIVYGVRSERKTDTWFKRTSARAFYRLQKAMGVEVVFDHADYRLLSARALDILSEYGEQNLFLRGIVPRIGLDSAVVEYERRERVAGKPKYPLRKMISFSIDGITSFTSRPMRLILLLGTLLLLLDVAVALYVFISYFGSETALGWPSLMLSVWFLGSVVLIGLGIIGEYVGKIYVEVKGRPRYSVKETLM